MLKAWRGIRTRAAELGRRLLAEARRNQACRALISIPRHRRVVAAISLVTAIDDSGNFRKSRSVAARIGLTTRQYQSGEADCNGHISRRVDRYLRGLLDEAAAATRSSIDCALAAVCVGQAATGARQGTSSSYIIRKREFHRPGLDVSGQEVPEFPCG